MNLVEVHDLSKSYNGNRALSSLELSIPAGAIYGLLGPNGAGKSTFLRILNQIIVQDSGTISFDGTSITRDTVRNLGYLPEERGLYKKMKVQNQIEYFARLKGISSKEARIRAVHWLEKLELKDQSNKKTMELSKGMQQKVQFIITVIHNPSLIILDEPFSGFDPINAQLIKNEIIELKKAGTTVLLSTHRMENVDEICEHVALLNKSRKLLEGPVKEVRKNHTGNLFKVVVGEALGEGVPGEINDHKIKDGRHEYKIEFEGASRSLLEPIMRSAEVYHFEEVSPTMEEIFLSAVKGDDHD